jgi:outer membrane protein OmpA-like peptidoglycan-associated protein
MKVFLLALLVFSTALVQAQHKNAELKVRGKPLMVSHLAGANRKALLSTNKSSRHFFLARVLCFRKSCRRQSSHSTSLRSVSFKKFRKRIKRNAKQGEYKRFHKDSTTVQKPVIKKNEPAIVEPVITQPVYQPKADSLIVLGAELLFETNKSTLRSEHFPMLDPIVDYLLAHPERSVKISGHSDNTGNQAHNAALSKRRADVVAEYLVNSGVDIDRVETFGYGSEKPLTTNNTEDGRRKNRRVELLIHSEP